MNDPKSEQNNRGPAPGAQQSAIGRAAGDRAAGEKGPRSPDRQRGYATLLGVYGAATASLVAIGARRRQRVSAPGPLDIALVGLATHKLSRLVTKGVITTPVRAPFTESDEPGNPGEVNTQPTGGGLQHAVGELLSCPFCADMWAATGLTAATVLTPRFGRSVSAVLSSVAIADYLHFAYTAASRATED